LTHKVTVSACIELKDLERLEDLSRQTGKSISSLVCTAVREFLEKKLAVERGQSHE
jgi:predicted DNA-binding protein